MSTIAPTPHNAADEQLTQILEAVPRPSGRFRRTSTEGLAPGRYLLVTQDDGEQRPIALTEAVTHIGRGVSADVRLDDHTVSARHAIIADRPAGLRILDDRSTNGTQVNGRRVEEAELHDGDVIVLGRMVLSYLVVR